MVLTTPSKKRTEIINLWHPFGLVIICIAFAGAPHSVHSLLRRQPVISSEQSGPIFVAEPPNKVHFSNSTGAIIPCVGKGNPVPRISWELADGSEVVDIPGLRHVRPDGSLMFPPFPSQQFSQEVHGAIYRCIAINAVGQIQSREVHLRAVVQQSYKIQIHDEFVIRGNSAVLRCDVPTFVKEYVEVVAWLKDDKILITFTSSPNGIGRFSLLSSGELHIRNASRHDAGSYRCQTRDRLTGEIITSSVTGRLRVTDPHGAVAPRVTFVTSMVRAVVAGSSELVCAAQSYPLPRFSFYKEEENGVISAVIAVDGILQREGSLVINHIRVSHSGKYICEVNNSVGEERARINLLVTEPLSVTVEPQRVEVDVGKSVTFNCSVTGTPVTSIYWLKDRRPLIIDSFESIGSESKRIFVLQPYALNIRSVNREDAGMYQCIASNDFESIQASGELKLGDIAPVIVASFEDMILEPSTFVSMRCIATGAPLPQIVWFLDDNQIPNAARFRVGDYVTTVGQVVSYVNISTAQIVDGGEYKCIASNDVGSAFYAGRLNVVGPPTARQSTASNITVVAGKQVVLRCPVVGYPLNSLKWEHNGHTLPINHRQKIEQLTQNGYGGHLRIDNIQRPVDEGDYSCIVKGSKTSSKGSVRVIIKVAPVIDAQPLPERVFTNEAMRVKLVCSVIQGDPPVDIKWYKEDMILVSSRYISLQNSEDYSLLTFKRVSFEDKGNYTCEARNDVDSVNRSSQLVVNVPPRWAIEPSDSFVVRGSSLSVDCQAEGFPVPRVRWTKAEGNAARNFKSIVSSPHLHVYENGSLTVHDARDADGGFYLCQASNGIGSGLSKVVKITVHVAAHFKSKFTAEMVAKGQNIRLKCEAFGNLPIAITWSKDKQKIDGHGVSSGNFAIGQGFTSISVDNRYEISETVEQKGVISEILIKKADRRDSALFTCLASNAYGFDDTNIQLMVQEPPDPPQDIMIVEITSRSVKLAWSPPYSGNSPISNYYIRYRNALDAHKIFHNVSIPGSESFGQVTGLKPAVMYVFTLIAENRVGKSEQGRAVEAICDEEAPGGPPTDLQLQAINAKAIKVIWKPPNRDLQYGVIKGYYIGYKLVGTSDSFIYKTLEVQEKFKEEAIISGLKRHSKYAIIVQTFNNKGAGPSSEESNIQTLEMDPPQTPQIHVASTSTSSVHLTWEPNVDESNPIDGYLLYQRKESPSEWREIRLQGHQTSYVGLNLNCGTRYQFHLIAYNRIGRGDKSDTLTVKTDGSVPVAPDKQSVISVNATTAIIHLDSWHNGGCPIQSFRVKYRPPGVKSEWIDVHSNKEDRQLKINALLPLKKYELQITATNEVGFTKAEYSFSMQASLTDELGIRSSTKFVRGTHKAITYQFGDYSFVIPILISTLVVFILLTVVCFVVKKRSTIDTTSSLYSAVIGRKQDSMQMTSLSKERRSSYGHETLPKMNGDCTHNQGILETEPFYAIVKQSTPRLSRTDTHIYSYPVPVNSSQNDILMCDTSLSMTAMKSMPTTTLVVNVDDCELEDKLIEVAARGTHLRRYSVGQT